MKSLGLPVSKKKNFENAFFVTIFKIVTPPQGGATFDPQGRHMYQLGRGPQGDAAHQLSKLFAFQFQRKRILKLIFFVPMFQFVTPGA